MVTRGLMGEGGINRDWDGHIHTTGGHIDN